MIVVTRSYRLIHITFNREVNINLHVEHSPQNSVSELCGLHFTKQVSSG